MLVAVIVFANQSRHHYLDASVLNLVTSPAFINSCNYFIYKFNFIISITTFRGMFFWSEVQEWMFNTKGSTNHQQCVQFTIKLHLFTIF